ncbi:MAG: glycosyltransferase [Clostridia bacterium]|nr:glycosyltransferase [Clostridia bacterium]
MILTVVCDVLGAENNGTTIAAMNLIRAMREKGHTVRVVCPDEEQRGESDYYVVRPISFGLLDEYVKKNGVCIAEPDENTLRRAIEGADAVHVMTPFLLSAAAVRIAGELGIPVTAGFHCQAENFTNHLRLMNARLVNRGLYKVFDRHVFSKCACIHYPTRFICDVFESETGRATNHRIISNGVGKAFERRPSVRPAEFADKFIVVYTGRYSREKSHSVLIDGVNLSKYRDGIQLVFAGAGPLREWLEKYSSALPNAPVFKFFSRSELVNLLNSADLYVHPAEIEIEAISCLEAISCGLVPLIADSPRSATRYFARDERNLFKCNDAADLAAKLDYWIENPRERRLCSDGYLGYARRFDRDACMDDMERMLLDVVRSGREAV